MQKTSTEQASKETLLKPAVKPQLALLEVMPFSDMDVLATNTKEALNLPSQEKIPPWAQRAAAATGEGRPVEEAAALHKGSFSSLSNCPVDLR